MTDHPTAPRRWRKWSEPQARRILDRLSRSGLSIAAFALAEGCSVSRIDYWRKRLAHSPQKSTPFVAVRVPHPQHTIKLHLHAITVELPADSSAERIADIAVALAVRSPEC
jgi:transposase-like protein